jgi:hypothetical protein
MPGVHVAAPATLPQVAPIGPPEGAQFDPLQQRFGWGAVWGVHVSPVPHPPVESQRHPRVPTMHVEEAPMPEPLPEPDVPELLPELDNAPELLPEPRPDAVDESSPPKEPVPPSAGPSVAEEPPQAPITPISDNEKEPT